MPASSPHSHLPSSLCAQRRSPFLSSSRRTFRLARWRHIHSAVPGISRFLSREPFQVFRFVCSYSIGLTSHSANGGSRHGFHLLPQRPPSLSSGRYHLYFIIPLLPIPLRQRRILPFQRVILPLLAMLRALFLERMTPLQPPRRPTQLPRARSHFLPVPALLRAQLVQPLPELLTVGAQIRLRR